MYSDIAYITGKGVIAEETLADLADKVNNPSDIAAAGAIANVQGAIARADGIIDSYLRSVYSGTLPLESPPEEVKTASAEIAVYLLWQSSNYPHDQNPLRDRHDYWMKFLRDVAAGKAVLELPGGETNPSAGIGYKGEYSDRVFSPDTLKGRF